MARFLPWSGRLGPYLALAGVLLPWQGRSRAGAAFLAAHPWSGGLLLALILGGAWLLRRGRTLHGLALSAAALILGQALFSYYYTGRPDRWLTGYYAPWDVPGWVFLELGLAGMIAAGLYRRWRGRLAGEAAPPPPPSGARSGWEGTWLMVPRASADNPLGRLLAELAPQRWRFEASGRLEINTWGMRRRAFYSREGGELLVRHPGRGGPRRYEVVEDTPRRLVIRDARRPGVVLTLEREAAPAAPGQD